MVVQYLKQFFNTAKTKQTKTLLLQNNLSYFNAKLPSFLKLIKLAITFAVEQVQWFLWSMFRKEVHKAKKSTHFKKYFSTIKSLFQSLYLVAECNKLEGQTRPQFRLGTNSYQQTSKWRCHKTWN